MAPAPFCPLRASAGLTEHGICRHCQRHVDRYLDGNDALRLEADRLLFDFDGYSDTSGDDSTLTAAA